MRRLSPLDTIFAVSKKIRKYRCAALVIGTKTKVTFFLRQPREQLEFLRFPLGDLTKSDTRDLAKSYELNVAAKPGKSGHLFCADWPLHEYRW